MAQGFHIITDLEFTNIILREMNIIFNQKSPYQSNSSAISAAKIIRQIELKASICLFIYQGIMFWLEIEGIRGV